MIRALRPLLRLAAGALALGAALVWLSGGCGERIGPGQDIEAEGARAPEGAATAPVEERTTPAVEWASGTIASAHETTISSKILARIAAIPVSAGSVVETGDVLVRLDARDLQARAQEAREALRAARARLDLAVAERDRIEKLVAGGAASRQQLDQARSAHRVAVADVQAAEQRVRDAEVGLSHAVITSPVPGRVIDRLAEPGDTAAPGAPLLRIYDPGTLRLQAPVRESLAVALEAGQRLRVEVDAIGATFDGTIDEIVPFAEPGSRTLLVKIRLPLDARLYAGMFGRAAVPAGEARRLLAPADAISRVGQLEFATVVDAEGRTERRLVTTGTRQGDGSVEILSGLTAGERVLRGTGPG